MSGCSIHQPFDALALQEKFPERLLQAHFPERDSADGDLNGGILQDSPRGLAQPLRGIDQPEESAGVEKQSQVPRNCDSLISQSSAIAIRALPGQQSQRTFSPFSWYWRNDCDGLFLATESDRDRLPPLRTASKASEKRLLNSPTLIVFTTAYLDCILVKLSRNHWPISAACPREPRCRPRKPLIRFSFVTTVSSVRGILLSG